MKQSDNDSNGGDRKCEGIGGSDRFDKSGYKENGD